MKIQLLALTLILFLAAGGNANPQGIYLDVAQLPEGWLLAGMHVLNNEEELAYYSTMLGTEITLIYNYYFDVMGTFVQINIARARSIAWGKQSRRRQSDRSSRI